MRNMILPEILYQRLKMVLKMRKLLVSALEKATFAQKYPQIIDEVTFFIKDVLSQFGLTENKTEQ